MKFTTDHAKLFSYHFKSSDDLVWKIKINGQYVKMRSGKSAWKKKSHAIAAIRHHFFSTMLSYELEERMGMTRHSWNTENTNAMIDWLVGEKILEFVELK